MARPLHYTTRVTLKIEKTPGERCTIIKLMGRIREEHLDELKAQITASAPRVVLELREVTLVDADAVRFLIACESEGIQLLNCSAYIREWIVRERESAIKG
jgi:anti-anti-sigma regulatory factor